MLKNKKTYLITAIFSTLLFASIVVFSTSDEATAQDQQLCSNMGCLWDETNCDLKPGNPNECQVACLYTEQQSCNLTSTYECEVATCG